MWDHQYPISININRSTINHQYQISIDLLEQAIPPLSVRIRMMSFFFFGFWDFCFSLGPSNFILIFKLVSKVFFLNFSSLQFFPLLSFWFVFTILAFFGNFRQEGPFSKSKDFQYLIFSDQLLGLSHFQQNSAKLINSASVSSKFQQISPISLSLPLDLVEARRFEESLYCKKSNHCFICGFSFSIGHFGMPDPSNILYLTERRWM